jgi:ABC-type multidrug transport system permease subunit
MLYNTPSSTAGVFPRSGVAFFAIVFLGWLQLSELIKAVSGRTVIARHKQYGFYRPSAVTLARVLIDFPLLVPQVLILGLIAYFMTGLDPQPSKFFIYLLFSYTTTICFTALYRMMAALSPTIDDAVRYCGTVLNVLLIYAGYIISKPILVSQKIWFGWIVYINPVMATTHFPSLPFCLLIHIHWS